MELKPSYPDEPLLGMFVGRTIRQLILFCDLCSFVGVDFGQVGLSSLEGVASSEARSELPLYDRSGSPEQFLAFARKWKANPIGSLAEAAYTYRVLDKAAVTPILEGPSTILDAIAECIAERFIRIELQRQPNSTIESHAVVSLYRASIVHCFQTFNHAVLGLQTSPHNTSGEQAQLPTLEQAHALIHALEANHPLLSEFLGYWYPLGDRQFYFFNSQFDYIADYSEFRRAQ